MSYKKSIICFNFIIGWLVNPVSADESAHYFDEKFTHFPGTNWQGDTSYFIITDNESEQAIRQTGGSGNGVNTLITNSSVLYGEWEFSVHFDGFSTSNQNRAWIWITTDSEDFQRGIAVRVGENGSQKFVRIFDYTGTGNPVEILRSVESLPENVSSVYLKIHHTSDDTWHLGTKYSRDSDYNWVSKNHSLPSDYIGRYFALQTVYTATRSDKFLFGPITIHKYPVFIRNVEIVSPDHISVFFSENITQSQNSLSISIDGYLGTIDYQISKNRVQILLSESLSGGIWMLNIIGLRDIHFDSREFSLSWQFEIFDRAELFDIVINEFTPRPESGNPIRFIELFNRSSKYINLENWVLGRQNQSIKLTFRPQYGFILSPGELAVIGQGLDGMLDPNSVLYVNQPIPVLGRTTDSIWLKSSDEVLIDSVRYDNRWSGILKDGLSIERINPNDASMDIQNWNYNPVNFSPGRSNDNYDSSTRDTKLEVAYVEDGKVTVQFNRFVRITDQTNIYVGGITPNSMEYSVWNANRFTLVPTSTDWINQRSTSIEIEQLTTFDEQHDLNFVEELAHPPDIGSLEVNEIMYQPIQNRYANFSDQSEYVELKNNRAYKLSLKDIFIRDTTDKNGQFRTWEPEIPDLWQVEANGYAILFPDTSNIWENMRLPTFFGVDQSNSWARTARSTLGLTSSGRGVYIQSRYLGTTDSVYYQPEWHHPLLRDSRGVSLEKLESNHTLSNAKWTSSADYFGGTPGRLNSAWMSIDEDSSEHGLFIHPNPFSPDNDGHEDFSRIHLKMPFPESSIRIRIFDRYGRLVRNLTRDTIIGNEFETTWDGLNDKKHVLQTGVYIVHVEVFYIDKKPKTGFKKIIVLVRRQ